MTAIEFGCVGSGGLLVLLSWIGAGWGIYRCLRLERVMRGDWGVLAAWGMAAFAVLGGVLAWGGIIGVGLVGSVSAAGAVLGGIAGWQWWARKRRWAWRWFWILPLGVLSACVYMEAVKSVRANPSDDQQAYFVFPTQMLESGTLLAPFNTRRVGTYGGHEFLKAQVMGTTELLWGRLQPAVGELCLEHEHVLDEGLCVLVAAGLAYGWAAGRGRVKGVMAGLLAALVLLMPAPRMNTQAEMSGVVLFLALGRMLPLIWRTGKGKTRRAVMVGIVATGIATLRMNFAGGAAVAVACSSAWSNRRGVAGWCGGFLRGWRVWVVLGIAILPWAMVLLESSGTLLYPAMRGNLGGAVSLLQAPRPAWERWRWAVESLAYPRLLILLAPMVLAIRLRRWRDCVPLYVGVVAMTLATAGLYTNQPTANLHRYCWPMAAACAVGTLAGALRRWGRLGRAERGATILLMLALPAAGVLDLSDTFRATWPLVMLGGFAALVAMELRREQWGAGLGVLAAGLLAWGVGANSGALVDDGAKLLCGLGIGGIAWVIFSARSHWARRVALAALVLACLLLGRGFFLLNGAFLGMTILLSIGGAVAAVWMVRRRVHRRWPVGPVALCLIGGWLVYAGMMAGGIMMAKSGGQLFFVLLVALAWSGARLTGAARAGAMVGVVGLAAVWIFSQGALSTWKEAEGRGASRAMNEAYRNAQASIPAGARVFVMLPEPARLDFSRNTVWAADYRLQFVSIPPFVPVDGDERAFREYWRGLGVRYMILDPRDSGAAMMPEGLMRNFAAVVRTGRRLFDSPEVVVVDLESR